MQRKTQQTEAIKRVFEENPRPMAVSEILQLAREHVPSLNQATVYRTITKLKDEQELIRVVHPVAGNLYEKAGKGMHNHFHCRLCDKVFELDPIEHQPDLPLPDGFVSEGFELFVYGVCDECASQTSEQSES